MTSTDSKTTWDAYSEFFDSQTALQREVEQAIKEIATKHGLEADVNASWKVYLGITESEFTVTWFEEGALTED